MTNWATLRPQKSRLPMPDDPFAETFRCERLAATLPRTQCANRYDKAQARTKKGAIDRRVTQFGPCRGCPVGLAHSTGGPTHMPVKLALRVLPSEQEAIVSTTEPAREYAERLCHRGKHKFKPTNATARACDDPECKSKHAGATPARAKAASKAARRAARRAAVPKAVPAIAAPTKFASPAELLELAGFKVRVLRTPSGDLLQVLR